ncbi:MAG: hypothetical protein IPK24_08615 [Kineosporiaceae bacterium]|nr:hypothetical protein [Kineosporiaceae bacterium]
MTTWTARSADQVGASCAALVLPGGYATGHGRYCPLLDLELRGLGRTLADRGADRGLAVHLLRYRNRGWNGARADPVVDTRWALTRLADRHGPVPVILVGYSMGGRAAVWAAGGANRHRRGRHRSLAAGRRPRRRAAGSPGTHSARQQGPQ